MRFAKNVLVMIVAVAMFGGLARGQVLKLVPSNALVVLKITNLQETSKKISDLGTTTGLVQLYPAMKDPLGELQKISGMSAGLNPAGDAVVVFVDPESVGGDSDMAMLALFPISDYKAFLGNWPEATTEADVTLVHLNANPQPSYIVNWGDYAAISPSKDLVVKKPSNVLKLSDVTAKAMDGKDIVLFANIKGWRPKMLAEIDKRGDEFNKDLDADVARGMTVPNMDITKMVPMFKAMESQMLGLAKKFCNDADSALITGSFTSDGTTLMDMVEFAADSPMGKDVAQIQNTSDSLLNGLPDGKYLAFGGCKVDPKLSAQIFTDFIDPIVGGFTSGGESSKPLGDFLQALKEMAGTQTQGAFGVMAPTGQLGVDPLFQFIAVQQGDPKVLTDAETKIFDAQQALMKGTGETLITSAMTNVPNAKTVDGVSFDAIKSTFDNSGTTQQQMWTQKGLIFLFGKDGAVLYHGAVNDNELLSYSGLPDEVVTTAITAIKANSAPMAKADSVKSIATKLPSQRMIAVYLPLDMLVSTALNYAKDWGIDPGVKIPEDLPPIGMTLSTEGTAVRMDAYVPTPLMQALVSAGIQIKSLISRTVSGDGGSPNGM